MPVKYVELRSSHAVQRALNYRYRLEMTAHIHHESAPAETRRVADRDRGQHAGTVLVGGQLQDRLESMHRTQIGCRRQPGSLRSDAQLIALILIDRLYRLTWLSYADGKRWSRRIGVVHRRPPHISTASAVQLQDCPFHGGFQPRVVRLVVAIGECRTTAPRRSDCECTLTAGERTGERHQREAALGNRHYLRRSRQCGSCQGEHSGKQCNLYTHIHFPLHLHFSLSSLVASSFFPDHRAAGGNV